MLRILTTIVALAALARATNLRDGRELNTGIELLEFYECQFNLDSCNGSLEGLQFECLKDEYLGFFKQAGNRLLQLLDTRTCAEKLADCNFAVLNFSCGTDPTPSPTPVPVVVIVNPDTPAPSRLDTESPAPTAAPVPTPGPTPNPTPGPTDPLNKLEKFRCERHVRQCKSRIEKKKLKCKLENTFDFLTGKKDDKKDDLEDKKDDKGDKIDDKKDDKDDKLDGKFGKRRVQETEEGEDGVGVVGEDFFVVVPKVEEKKEDKAEEKEEDKEAKEDKVDDKKDDKDDKKDGILDKLGFDTRACPIRLKECEDQEDAFLTCDAPTMSPSAAPSEYPTSLPSAVPSIEPSSLPSQVPSAYPTSTPSVAPSPAPVPLGPTPSPTPRASEKPSFRPSASPSAHPSPAPSMAPTPDCLDNLFAILQAVNGASTNINTPTDIYICRGLYEFPDEIDVANKSFRMICVLPQDCIFSGRKKNRMFIGAPAFAGFYGLWFEDGVAPPPIMYGGALCFTGGIVEIEDTVFVYNSADSGGAIFAAGADMQLTITGSKLWENLAHDVSTLAGGDTSCSQLD